MATWKDREVQFKDISYKEMRTFRKIEDREDGMLAVLAASAYYIDTGDKVWASLDEVTAEPSRLMVQIIALAGEAFRHNSPTVDEDPSS